ncbi:hypothetical protein MMC16_006421 [Acarospora aff. strigata]|nr:hypothetical protein [Acarospora aff. strigata]
MLSVPPQFFSIDPLWRNSDDGFRAFYDPPKALLSRTGFMDPPSVTRDSGDVQPVTTAAQASSSPEPATVSSTKGDPHMMTTALNLDPEPSLSSASLKTDLAPPDLAPAMSKSSFSPQNSVSPIQSLTASALAAPTEVGGTIIQNPDRTHSAANPTAGGNQPIITTTTTDSKPTLFNLDNSNVIIGDQTATAGAATMTINNIPLSFGSAGFVISDTSTIPLFSLIPDRTGSSALHTLTTIAGQPILIGPSSGAIIIGVQTLSHGVSVSVSGSGRGSALSAQRLTPGTHTYTVTLNTAGDIMLGPQTLTPGAVATVDGETISRAASGAVVVVAGDGSTVSRDVGWWVASGLGITGQGRGCRRRRRRRVRRGGWRWLLGALRRGLEGGWGEELR